MSLTLMGKWQCAFLLSSGQNKMVPSFESHFLFQYLFAVDTLVYVIWHNKDVVVLQVSVNFKL